MPIQIDRMDTSVEILPPSGSPGAVERRGQPQDAAVQDALRDMVGKVMTDELERFLRNRGL